ncbi:homeobox protein pnx-like [Battus philenor]|uniref:homeobox protein pnx-like n=1 Tax=Battus philenor TaxID=42288 RepID=UPI0035D0A424
MSPIGCWENRPFTNVWPNTQQYKQNGVKRAINKKKRNRTAYTTEQIKLLENTYIGTKYIGIERRRTLARVLGVDERCIKIWFQNRRMKEKRRMSESSNSSLENYTDSTSPCPLSLLERNTTQNFDAINITTHHNANEIEQENPQQNEFTINSSNMNSSYFYNSMPTPSSFYNDTNGYPTQYYPYGQNEYNFNSEPNHMYYEYISDKQTTSEHNFSLTYL